MSSGCKSAMLCAAQHFEGFDPEGFSIWFCEYKYPEENTVNFIVMNKARPTPAAVTRCICLLWCTGSLAISCSSCQYPWLIHASLAASV